MPHKMPIEQQSRLPGQLQRSRSRGIFRLSSQMDFIADGSRTAACFPLQWICANQRSQ
ncbi:hypothetical protein [Pseudomonas chlororaphis]|uniref:hypothetical protein n=1 Tax=Pseudomonas chlororaphis TaxID=587753 RepID=UPI002407ABA5|nr:hypothetical protein [Pseudomonas chlororaphis]